ncbi:MAG TPA: TRAP transporter small permease [Acidimicrobiia bacterium]|nr:TRAP transporter small permease [Acidimicrobiia bacterium]
MLEGWSATVPAPQEDDLLMAQNDGPPTDGTDPVDENPTAGPSTRLHTDEPVVAKDPPLLPSREPMRTTFRVLGVLEQILGSLLLLLVLILVLTQIAYRYIPGGAPWTGELARLSMVWATFLLAGYLIAYSPHHIAIQVIDYVAKGRWLAGVKLFVNAVILLTCLLLIYGNITLLATDIGQVTPAGEIPLRFVNAVPLIGLVLVAVRVGLAIAIRDLPALRQPSGDST